MISIEERLQFIKDNCHSIINIGAGFNDNLRSFFQKQDYKTVDINTTYKPDIIADAHNLPLADNSVDAIVSFNLLEHLHSPHLAVSEMRRVLRKGGVILLSTPFIHPYHGGNCPDYWRFSRDGLKFLFAEFSEFSLSSDGGFLYACIYFIPQSLQWLRPYLKPILIWLDSIFTRHRSSSHAHIVWAIK